MLFNIITRFRSGTYLSIRVVKPPIPHGCQMRVFAGTGLALGNLSHLPSQGIILESRLKHDCFIFFRKDGIPVNGLVPFVKIVQGGIKRSRGVRDGDPANSREILAGQRLHSKATEELPHQWHVAVAIIRHVERRVFVVRAHRLAVREMKQFCCKRLKQEKIANYNCPANDFTKPSAHTLYQVAGAEASHYGRFVYETT